MIDTGKLFKYTKWLTSEYVIFMCKQNLVLLIVFISLVWGNFEIYSFYSNNYLRIYFLDVGQGDSILIITPNERIFLIDAGADERSVKAIGQILPFYIRDIDYFIATHSDYDHIGGIDELLASYDVSNIYINRPVDLFDNDYANLIKSAGEKQIPISTLYANSWINMEGLEINVISPREDEIDAINSDNARSISTYLSFGNFDALLTGDLEEEGEKKLFINNTNIDLYKMGHHGSKSSSSEAFINKITPRVSVVSVGKNNKYGHPNKEAMERVLNTGSKIYSTQDLGTILINVDSNNYSIENI